MAAPIHGLAINVRRLQRQRSQVVAIRVRLGLSVPGPLMKRVHCSDLRLGEVQPDFFLNYLPAEPPEELGLNAVQRPTTKSPTRSNPRPRAPRVVKA